MSPEIVPTTPEPGAATADEVGPPAPRKKRRGWIIALVVVGVLVVLAVVGFFVGDAVAKAYARDYVRERVADVLQLPEDADVEVDLGGGSIILQALAGRVETVDVHVPEAVFGELTGTVRMHAEGVPLDDGAPVDILSIDFAIDADDLAALSQGADADAAPSFEFVEGAVSLSSDFDLFGATVPLGLSLVPSASDGALVLTPTSLTIGTQTFESGADDGSFLGQIAAAFLQPQTLCVAGSVPRALLLDDASVDGAELVLTFTGDGAALGGPEFSTSGVCPAA